MVSKKKNYLCEGWIEKSIPRDHRLSSLGKPHDAKGSDPRDGFFYPTLTFMRDSYNIKNFFIYGKPYVKLPLSERPKFGFQDQLSLNAGQKYYRMLQGTF